jgi:hypothetical protein
MDPLRDEQNNFHWLANAGKAAAHGSLGEDQLALACLSEAIEFPFVFDPNLLSTPAQFGKSDDFEVRAKLLKSSGWIVHKGNRPIIFRFRHAYKSLQSNHLGADARSFRN